MDIDAILGAVPQGDAIEDFVTAVPDAPPVPDDLASLALQSEEVAGLMPVKLIVAAGNWESKEVKCTFTVQADEVTLVAKDRASRSYELPPAPRR